MIITPEQIRAARALLRLEQTELAARANVSVVTIRRMESVAADRHVAAETLEGVRHVLEQAGAEFIKDGVRRRPAKDKEKLFQDLLDISRRSAAKIVDRTDFLTDDDLYDENGLPH